MNSSRNLANLSVVVTCYNKFEYIDPVFAHLEEMASLGAEIVMVDDGSTDGSSIKLLEKKASSGFSFFLEKIENRGLAGARDFGILQSTKDYVFCLDIDDTPNTSNLIDFYFEFRNSGAQLGQANFTFSETNTLGSVAIETDSSTMFNTRDLRDSVFNSRSWWRFIYRRDFLLQHENRFGEIFLELKGKSFVLDDIFWMLHLSAVDLTIYQSASTTSIYNYFLPEFNGPQRWKSYVKQIMLLPEATILYVKSLGTHTCTHDEKWMYGTLLKVLWDHSTLLSQRQFLWAAISFLRAGFVVSKRLGFQYQALNLLYFALAPLRIMKYRLRH